MNEPCAKVIGQDVLYAQTAIFAHGSIHIENLSIGSVHGNALIDGVGDAPQLPFVLTELLLPMLMLNSYSRQVRNLPDEVLVLRSRATGLARVDREGA